jgi:ureidoacrylate peracid hydrolase
VIHVAPIIDPSDPYLAAILSPQQAALLVVDVQNDFCHEHGLFGKLGMEMKNVQAAARRINALLLVARRSEVPIIFIAMEHDASTNSRAWINRNPTPRADACIAGTWGAEFYIVAPAAGEPVVVKHRYSPFVGTNIEYLLRAKERKSLIVTGVATNICVEAILRDAFIRDYDVVLVEDCAAAYSQRAHQSTVDNTCAFLGRVITCKTLMEHWSSLSPDRADVSLQVSEG